MTPTSDDTPDPATVSSAPAPAVEAGASSGFDPGADPLADPALADLVDRRLLAAADHPWELEHPPGWDPLEATERFLKLVRDVNGIVGQECEADLWPLVKAATFHGEIVLPPAALRDPGGSAVVRASNFGGLLAVLSDDATTVRPDVMGQLRRRFERNYYKLVPAAQLRRAYDGHHRGTKLFPTWRDRLFGYL